MPYSNFKMNSFKSNQKNFAGIGVSQYYFSRICGRPGKAFTKRTGANVEKGELTGIQGNVETKDK